MLHAHELIIDSFAGGGGASLGIELALGRSPDVAINHDAEAIALHQANHPTSKHYREDVWQVDPLEATGGRPVGLMWLSPDCKHFSKAKGGKPVSPRVRGLAWVAIRWANAVRPRVICLENVEEFQTWGPLVRATQKPCPARRGKHFRAFVRNLERLGYRVEHRQLRGCDYGSPTIRKRLFLIARCDGQPIVWPRPTHGKGLPKPWRAAAECIDWSLECRSIFGRPRPLAANTQKRIAAGMQRYVLGTPRPFIVQVQNASASDTPISIDAPLRTITAYPKGGGFALVVAFLAKHQSERDARQVQAASLFDPLPTVKARDSNALVVARLGADHSDDVHAFLVAYYGKETDGGDLFSPMRTITSKERFGLVTVAGQLHAIADIGMRMLAPRELYRAQGFPDSYKIDIPFNGKPMSKTAQVRMCGNSVCPPVAAAIVAANLGQRLPVAVAA
ncbi:MAG TPA: DNA cytosine methyltransferase [Gemmatimonas aurantiaca]|uniref:DNA (cytosine-5-)-methyltransferase n=2 Tax=Gemmatimonas aurantiaca TaxID=173480 RepID=C1A429_GEMAT|nr:DNA cytosine methyltransferase [Gemmatimonas aurantiaca]BAH38854.1 DNA methyltransferase [Gemmatimonas aurantiaca T-27]HCT57261.1 DNA cytosine methyltransferase [Gemmatimonas aurantiaca]